MSVMSSTRKSSSENNWLLVEWNSGGRDVVYVKSVLKPVNKELKIGEALLVNRRGEQEGATLIARARERAMLDSMVKKPDAAGPSGPSKPEKDEDFSSSASDWLPSDDGAQSEDSGEEKIKKIKLERYKRQYSNRRSSTKVLTPSNKANAVLSTVNRKRPHNDSVRNEKLENHQSVNKSLPDSTKMNKSDTERMPLAKMKKELIKIKKTFKILFKELADMKRPLLSAAMKHTPAKREPSDTRVHETTNPSYSQVHDIDEDKENYNQGSENEDFNRSDDNVLITNKYVNVGVRNVETKEPADQEWIPIGSGKTLIHKDKFKRINWKSYTIATRTLLLAVFPRRILATHSLTGKRSPAFQNKPAKMCLDPKIISDVIMEIMDRFHVRENLVRSIITTKCADECKMWKTRVNKKKPAKNNENAQTTSQES